MKRDFSLLRDLLLAIEENDKVEFTQEGKANAIELGHYKLLMDAGYVEGKPYLDDVLYGGVEPSRLTMKGHDYLDTIRKKSLASIAVMHRIEAKDL